MTSLVEFLSARVAEDEAAAKAVTDFFYSEGRWEWNLFGHVTKVSLVDERGVEMVATKGDGPTWMVNEHISRHDPARVLAECAAKRAIIEAVGAWRHEVVEDCWYTCAAATEERDGGTCCDDNRRDVGECDCGLDYRVARILGPLAAIHADHADYDPSWAV